MTDSITLAGDRPGELKLSPDGNRIYSADTDGFVRVYDARTGSLLASWDVGENLRGLDISPAGDFLIIVERNLSTTYRVDTATGTITSFPYDTQQTGTPLFDVAILSNGTALFSPFGNLGPMQVLNFQTGTYTAGPVLNGPSVLTRSPTGSDVLIEEGNNSAGALFIYRAGTGIIANTVAGGFNDGIQAFTGSLVANYVSNEGILVYDISLQRQATLTAWNNGLVTDLAFSPDGAWLYVLENENNSIIQVSTTDWSIEATIPVGADVGDWIGQVDATRGSRLLLDPSLRYFSVATDTGLVLVANPDAPPIQGTSGDDILSGTLFTDEIDGGAGNDIISGSDGGDHILGGTGNDELYGDNGDDILVGGPGSDKLNGGLGVDTADYSTAVGPVSVSLLTGQAFETVNAGAGEYSEDLLVGIENIVGSNFADQLTGDVGDNRLDGGNGNDDLTGWFGHDMLIGGAGNDTIAGGADTDTLTGGSGNDTFRDTARDLNGDTITDFIAGDRIIIADASFAGFTFSLTGSTLTYTGGSLTFAGGVAGRIVATAAAGSGVQLTIAPRDIADDFNGDGRSDVVWRNGNGAFTTWLGQANGGFVSNDAISLQNLPTSWHVVGTGDFNGDGRDDIVWRNDNGAFTAWLAQGGGSFASNDANAWTVLPTSWKVNGTGDFNGDGRCDIAWRNDNGAFTTWLGQATGGFVSNDLNSLHNLPTSWHVVGTGDFNGEGRDDIVWRNDNGTFTEWLGQANGGFLSNDANALAVLPNEWRVDGTGDFNGDGRDDLIWRRSDGAFTTWLGQSHGGFVSNDANSWAVLPNSWQVQATGDYNGDGRDDIIWRRGDGAFTEWLGEGSGSFASNDAHAWTILPNAWQVQGPDTFWA